MLRSGYTTGACAAAASKAAVARLLSKERKSQVTIPFPDGSRVQFVIQQLEVTNYTEETVKVSVIKDAGDDPDVTNGAEIVAVASFKETGDIQLSPQFYLTRGEGIGLVTKPGLAVEVGEPAINPVPRQMLLKAVEEVLHQYSCQGVVHIELSVSKGAEIAKKTLNERLGIIGGISILGTTGIVKPISARAWKETVKTSMSVAKNMGLTEIAVSTGRTSEAAIQKELDLPQEAYVEMGDYLEFTLQQACEFDFSKIYYGGMWAKVLKGSMGWRNTHVRNGALEIDDALRYLIKLGVEDRIIAYLHGANSARDIYEKLLCNEDFRVVTMICLEAKKEFERISSLPVKLYLVDANKEITVRI